MKKLLIILMLFGLLNSQPRIDSIIPVKLTAKGNLLISSGKTVTWNGSSKTVESQTDTTALFAARPKGNNRTDTLIVNAGSLADTGTVKTKFTGNKGIVGIR